MGMQIEVGFPKLYSNPFIISSYLIFTLFTTTHSFFITRGRTDRFSFSGYNKTTYNYNNNNDNNRLCGLIVCLSDLTNRQTKLTMTNQSPQPITTRPNKPTANNITAQPTVRFKTANNITAKLTRDINTVN